MVEGVQQGPVLVETLFSSGQKEMVICCCCCCCCLLLVS